MKRVGKKYVCAVCDEPLNEVTVAQQDPFCSTVCAKEFHGVEVQKPWQGTPVGSSS